MSTKKFMAIAFGVLLPLAFYPLLMGAQLLTAYLRQGYVDVLLYPKYVIPYTPISIALLVCLAVLPLAVKYCKRFALLAESLLGTGLFLLTEHLFEQVTVFNGDGFYSVGSWQYFLCRVTTPKIVGYTQSIGDLASRWNPFFKVHFYLIALLIILATLGVLHGFYKQVQTGDASRKKPLLLQAASTAVFLALCIFACFTAFFRTGGLDISALSACLMAVFFIVFGLTAGGFAGSLLYFKRPALSLRLPACLASIVTFVMYLGELIMLGDLYLFGSGIFFEPIGVLHFAPVDLLIIAASGALTHLLLRKLRDPRVAADKAS